MVGGEVTREEEEEGGLGGWRLADTGEKGKKKIARVFFFFFSFFKIFLALSLSL